MMYKLCKSKEIFSGVWLVTKKVLSQKFRYNLDKYCKTQDPCPNPQLTQISKSDLNLANMQTRYPTQFQDLTITQYPNRLNHETRLRQRDLTLTPTRSQVKSLVGIESLVLCRFRVDYNSESGIRLGMVSNRCQSPCYGQAGVGYRWGLKFDWISD